MERTVPLKTPAELTVTVSREDIEIVVGKAAGKATKTVSTAKPIEIHVTAVANCSVVGIDRTEIVVPRPGEPEVYVFNIRGEQPGAAEVWVDAMQGARRLARFVLQPQFVASGKISTSANVSTAQDDPPMLGIRVYEVPTGRKDSFYLRFVVESRDLNLRMEEVTDEFDVPPEEYIKSLYNQLEGSWGAGLTFEQYMVRLRSFGNTLYRKLVPERVQRAIWDKRESIGSIEIISHEPLIPWEVLHISEPGQKLPPQGNVFLGELGVVRWLPNAGWAPAAIKFRLDHARHVIPDYANPVDVLEGAVEERAMVETLFHSKPLEANSATLIYDLKSHADVDVLHFACHGAAEGDRIWDASLLMAGTRDKDSGKVSDDVLTVDLVENYAELSGADGSRPIVFLNACQAGKAGRALVGTGGMAQAFIGGGAGLFIGTQWSIGDKTALVFASTFYQRLLAGETVNQATRGARRAAKTAEEPTWLAYTVYGHPYARLAME